AGLEGAGVDELFRVLFGLQPMTGGEIILRGALQRPASPRAAIRRGWALVPASRREQGLMMEWSIARNTTLVVLDELLTRVGLIDHRAVGRATGQYIQQLRIATDSQDKKVVNLSGGNQ